MSVKSYIHDGSFWKCSFYSSGYKGTVSKISSSSPHSDDNTLIAQRQP